MTTVTWTDTTGAAHSRDFDKPEEALTYFFWMEADGKEVTIGRSDETPEPVVDSGGEA